MEDSLSIPALPIECHACYAKGSADDVYCTNCGYPLKGTEQEQQNFILKKNFTSIDLGSFNKRLKTAANSLYYLGGAFVVYGIIFYFIKQDDPDATAMLLTNLILGFVYVALGSYTHKKPLACIVSGLCLYAIVIILNAIANPVSIASGIIVKILIIGYLIKGIKGAIEIERIKKENSIA
jgi:hypothetical protein